MRFEPQEHSQTKPAAKGGIEWSFKPGDGPESLRGRTLKGGVPCFVGEIDYCEDAVKFAAPMGMTQTIVVRITKDRDDLRKLRDAYIASTPVQSDAYVPPTSLRAELIREAEKDANMPKGLKRKIMDGRSNWQDDEDADYLIHGVN